MVEGVQCVFQQGEFRVKCPNGTVAYFREDEINYWDEGEENKRLIVSSCVVPATFWGSHFQICVYASG